MAAPPTESINFLNVGPLRAPSATAFLWTAFDFRRLFNRSVFRRGATKYKLQTPRSASILLTHGVRPAMTPKPASDFSTENIFCRSLRRTRFVPSTVIYLHRIWSKA